MGLTPKNKIIPKWILRNNSYRKACVRGLFDTEGSISFKIYKSKKGISVYKQLNFRNVDVNFMIFVRDTLVTLGFKPTMTLKKSLYLSNHQAIEVFRRNIGFSNPKLLIRSFICTIQDYETWKSALLLTPSSTVV